MMEGMLPVILCWHLFSLLQRTLSKREDQSSDHTSAVQWLGNSPGKKRLFNYVCVSHTRLKISISIENFHFSCVFCVKQSVSNTECALTVSLGHTHLQDCPCTPSPRPERCAASRAPFFSSPQPQEPLPQWRESVSGALGLLLFGACSCHGWVSLQERFEQNSPALTRGFSVRLLHKRQVTSPPPPLPAFRRETSS